MIQSTWDCVISSTSQQTWDLGKDLICGLQFGLQNNHIHRVFYNEFKVRTDIERIAALEKNDIYLKEENKQLKLQMLEAKNRG